jgi:Tol biopolymer transport system component
VRIPLPRLFLLALAAFVAVACGSERPDDSATKSCPHEMTFSPGREHENVDPAWSPDGTEIAFTTDGYGRIAAIDVKSCSVRTVTEGLGPTWSPDGKRLAFQRETHGSPESGLFVAGADGSNVRRITNGDGDQAADWSPNGDRIAFFSYDAQNVYVVRPDGTGRRRLAKVHSVGDPAWSPDGRQIAVECGDEGSICMLDPGGREVRRLRLGTDAPDVSWSPDGDTLTFSGNTGMGLGAWLLPLETGKARLLLPSRHNAVDVDWSPDGRWIAVAITSGDEASDLYLVRPDGTGLRRLTRSDARVHEADG